ncbi:MAG: SulP family inorganic anion transporter, partial [Bacteroidota bacterium]
MKISSFLPFLQWSRQYQKAWLKADLVAGLTVGVMLIPQAMAYALLAGMPPIYGLYASTLPLLIYAFLGTSRQLSVGPVAMIALLTAAGIGSLAESGSAEYIRMAILLALMAGVLQFGFGLFRLGFVVNFLSRPVISGFTSAAGLIIFFSHLKHLLGLQIPRTGYIHQIV